MIVSTLKNIIHSPFTNINFYNRATLPFIAYNIIIGPHGITDLIYALKNKKILQLFGVYSFSSYFFNWLHIKQYESISNSLFLGLSAIHFKDDIPINNKYIQLFLSVLFIANLKTIGLPIFLLYMCLVHVPNHYLSHKDLLSKNKSLSYILISSVSLLLCNSQNHIEHNTWFIKGIIASHILFEELYCREKHKNILNHIFNNNDKSNNMAIYI